MPDVPAAHIRFAGSSPTWNCAGTGTTILRGDAKGATLTVGGRTRLQWVDPLEGLSWMATQRSHRWAGYLSYDLGRRFESLPSQAADDLQLPLYAFAMLDGPATPQPTSPATATLLRSTFTRDAYEKAVARVVDYIAAGDIFQVNLSQRYTAASEITAASLFERLQQQSPADFGAMLDFGDFALVSNSPELFLHVSPMGRVATRPIKGTRPRQPGMDDELRSSIKDKAELNMIVDLERNDLGRVCEIGSVRVTQPRTIEAHPTVYHGVATVEGQLRKDVGLVELLRATFPGGSITGAPKIRAMQIIEELEPFRRGPYCGAIGYLDPDGSMQFNVAIRTMILKQGLVHIPVGGGIVADSSPAAEYEETLVKARAMFTALGI
jgi:anthranilate/para-aminobenzoate synthase component I